MQGIIKNFNAERNFGFIRSESGAEDFFVHMRDFRELITPAAGDRVQFDPIRGAKGMRAGNVSRIDDAGASSAEKKGR